MSNARGVTVDSQDAQRFLNEMLRLAATEVALIGEGAWSRCFGFRQDGEELAIRFGHYVDDFQKDQFAQRYAAPALPIPEVLAIGNAFGGYYAISRRVHGIPLERASAEQWLRLAPAVVAALEALRVADIADTVGFGGWDAHGQASEASWSSRLLTVGKDEPTSRIHGWRHKLATVPEGDAAFVWGFDLLQQVVTDDVPRSLIHCDLVNRNVLVEDERITGIFDWGCSVYGDHLYELAWFEFWAPWYPHLDIAYLRSALEAHWHHIGYAPPNQANRLAACYLHIGLDHLAYNAHLGDWPTLLATAERMRTLVEQL